MRFDEKYTSNVNGRWVLGDIISPRKKLKNTACSLLTLLVVHADQLSEMRKQNDDDDI